MALTDEQSSAVKEQLMQQIANLPEDKQPEAKEYINSMDNQQIEEFLQQNKMMAAGENQCIFCSIIDKKIPSISIYENKEHLAVLDIKPFSKGHVVLIPKKHITTTKDLPKKSLTIANQLGIQIAEQLKADSFEITTGSELGHAIVNIIPTYKDKQLTYQREDAKPENLEKLAKKIQIKIEEDKPKEEPKPIKLTKKQVEAAIIKLDRRIP